MTEGSIKREGDVAVIRLPMSQVHDLRVALTPIGQGATTSNETKELRERLSRGLARLQSKGRK